jgi:SAM-dependent methyltransferase
MSQSSLFNDGAVYENAMGVWSRHAGAAFLDWLAPRPGLAWIDIGCGNGAFTELLMARCQPASVHGIDPSREQLAYARTRPGTQGAIYAEGDAMALPFPDRHFDAAVMALVLFFVPQPARGVAEMARVTRPGGPVAAYTWDTAAGTPARPLQDVLRDLGRAPIEPTSRAIANEASLAGLWRDAGLASVATRTIEVARVFPDFETFWRAIASIPLTAPTLAAMPPDEIEEARNRLRAAATVDAAGRVTQGARAVAVKGVAA